MEPIDFSSLIAKYFQDELSEDERIQLQEWRSRSEDNERIFAQFQEVWQVSNAKEPQLHSDPDAVWHDLERRIEESGDHKSARRLPFRPSYHILRSPRMWVAAAAVFLVAAALVPRILDRGTALQSLRTGQGQQREWTLPDGSQVTLNSDTELIFEPTLSDSVRRVKLRGEAFFQVVANPRPFVVQTRNAEVRVLGTQFNVSSRDSQTRVLVKEGLVTFRSLADPNHEGVLVTTNQVSACQGESAPSAAMVVNADDVLTWLHRELVFKRTPLSEIVAELRRYYGAEIVLADSSLATYSITGSFKHRSLELVLDSICRSSNLSWRREAGRYIVQP